MMKHDVMLGGCGTDPFENYAASNWIYFPRGEDERRTFETNS